MICSNDFKLLHNASHAFEVLNLHGLFHEILLYNNISYKYTLFKHGIQCMN